MNGDILSNTAAYTGKPTYSSRGSCSVSGQSAVWLAQSDLANFICLATKTANAPKIDTAYYY